MSTCALDSKKNFVRAKEAERGTNYFCLECGTKVRLKMGEERRAHFYHLEPTLNCRESGKSLEHLMTQVHIQNAFQSENKELILEKRFDSIRRIADCVAAKEKIVYEIQCSPMSALEAKERMRDYNQIGYQVVWILHTKTFLKNKATAFENLLHDTPHYFTDIDEEGRGDIFDQFAPIKKGFRHVRSRAYPLEINTFSPRKPSTFRSTWPLSFQGDILYHLGQKTLDEKTRDAIFRALYVEKEAPKKSSTLSFIQKGLLYARLFFEEELRAAASK